MSLTPKPFSGQIIQTITTDELRAAGVSNGYLPTQKQPSDAFKWLKRGALAALLVGGSYTVASCIKNDLEESESYSDTTKLKNNTLKEEAQPEQKGQSDSIALDSNFDYCDYDDAMLGIEEYCIQTPEHHPTQEEIAAEARMKLQRELDRKYCEFGESYTPSGKNGRLLPRCIETRIDF